MGSVYYGVHKPIALEMRSKYNLTHFIETGTWMGDSAAWAIFDAGFPYVATAEIAQNYYEHSHERLSGTGGVYLYYGDSREFLKEVLESLDETDRCLFWLDAHWDGEASQSDPKGPCPVLDEIAIINAACKAKHVIMVDDVRMFSEFPGVGWGGKDEVIQALMFGGKRFVFTQDDVFVGEPADEQT